MRFKRRLEPKYIKIAKTYLKCVSQFIKLVDDSDKYSLDKFMLRLAAIVSRLYYLVLRLPEIKLEDYYGRKKLKTINNYVHCLRFEMLELQKKANEDSDNATTFKNIKSKRKSFWRVPEKYICIVHFFDMCQDLRKILDYFKLPDKYNLKPYAFYCMRRDFFGHWYYHVSYMIKGINKWLYYHTYCNN